MPRSTLAHSIVVALPSLCVVETGRFPARPCPYLRNSPYCHACLGETPEGCPLSALRLPQPIGGNYDTAAEGHPMRSPSPSTSWQGATLPHLAGHTRRRRSVIERPPAVPQPGWWARLTVSTPGEGSPDIRVRQQLAPRASSALGWLRIGLRVFVSAMDEDDREATLRWLTQGQGEALLLLLKSGSPIDRCARAGAAVIEWSVAPVLLLPRAPLRPGPAPCVESSWCRCVAPDHICGGEHV
jgi:hypothetical protein